MIFQRLIWAALATALIVGALQTGIQRWQAVPLILAAEVFEEQKTDASRAEMAITHEHNHGETEWEPGNGMERTAWTFVANMLHAFGTALLVFTIMGIWLMRHGSALASLPLASLVAAAGWFSLHLWPTLGLPAELPGMEAAPLHARQLWWLLAAGSASLACAVASFAVPPWRWFVTVALLILPFAVGAPQLHGDTLTGYDIPVHGALEQLESQFFWVTTWISLSFWISIGVVTGYIFQHWLRPSLGALLLQHGSSANIDNGLDVRPLSR